MNKAQYLDELLKELKKYNNANYYDHISEYDIIINEMKIEGLSNAEITKRLGNPTQLATEIANEFNYKKSGYLNHMDDKTKNTIYKIVEIVAKVIIVITIIMAVIFIAVQTTVIAITNFSLIIALINIIIIGLLIVIGYILFNLINEIKKELA